MPGWQSLSWFLPQGTIGDGVGIFGSQTVRTGPYRNRYKSIFFYRLDKMCVSRAPAKDAVDS